MAEIIWKGKSSREIKGLIITDIPPITKPKLRINKTSIEGRDGDIVETVGYESYSKSIGIGLTRNYDIDEIIKYFSGDGELVIGDEPSKVYLAGIYDDIDYERLLSLRKATIKFHVQPFKYLKDEQPVVQEIQDETFLNVFNQGLEIAKPIIQLEGTGVIEISINGTTIFQYKFPDEETKVTIDSLEEEAYQDGIFKNRNMIGEFPKLDVGNNTISWTGTLTKIVVEPKSRWL